MRMAVMKVGWMAWSLASSWVEMMAGLLDSGLVEQTVGEKGRRWASSLVVRKELKMALSLGVMRA